MNSRSWSFAPLLAVVLAAGCAQQTPTIAHVHLGHSITGAFDTPGRVGYLDYATQLAEEALEQAESAVADGRTLAGMQQDVARVSELSATEVGSGERKKKVVLEAVDHVKFAAESEDASENVKRGFRDFDQSVQGVLVRDELIASYAEDIQAARSAADARPLADEVYKLAYANVHGEDVDGNGQIDSPREYGLRQISERMKEVVDNESPPYTTVDRWYLFNLIRLPNGVWIFRRPSDPAGDPY